MYNTLVSMVSPIHHTKALLAVAAMVIIHAVPVHAFGELRLIVPDFRPYTYEENGSVRGTGYARLQKILKVAGIPFSSIVVSSLDTALSEIRAGSADAFFPAAARPDRDAVAVYAGPVLLHRWTWFLPAGSTFNPSRASFKSYARVGTLQHSSMHTWLKNNGYAVTGIPASTHALIAMLKKGTINSILMPEAEFLDSMKNSGEDPSRYKMVVLYETPLGLYVSKAYLGKNPGVMDRIVKALVKMKEGEGK